MTLERDKQAPASPATFSLLGRSILFNLSFYFVTLVMLVGGLPFLALPNKWFWGLVRIWVHISLFLLRVTCGTSYEVRGRERLPDGPTLLAAKHQSTWDILIYLVLVDRPAIVLKSELMWIPLFGWYAARARMIPVTREAGSRAIPGMLKASRAALAAHRSILIFPQGTRVAPGTARAYRAGVGNLYSELAIPCVPIAVNSGLFWPRRKLLHLPGTITVEFLDPIPSGLDQEEFMATLENRVERGSDALMAEAGFVV